MPFDGLKEWNDKRLNSEPEASPHRSQTHIPMHVALKSYKAFLLFYKHKRLIFLSTINSNSNDILCDVLVAFPVCCPERGGPVSGAWQQPILSLLRRRLLDYAYSF